MYSYMKFSVLFSVAILSMAGCGNKNGSFSTLPTGQSFMQSNSRFNNQLDILWVVDNSGSMSPLQANMTSNFTSFINTFQNKGYDYRMTVTTTDAYKANKKFSQYSSSNDGLSLFQDGAPGYNPSNVFVIIPTTPNQNSVFVTNATTGINGSGDERAFSSMMTALNNPSNPSFLRPNSFFAIIILSDEDDFSLYSRTEGSWNGNAALDHCYADPTLDGAATTAYSGNTHVSTCASQTPPDSVNSYVTALDTLTNSTGATRRYNVSAITVLDSACQQQHSGDPSSFMSVIGQRYMQLSNATNGTLGSICDSSYATALNNIQSQITELSTQFFLKSVPQINSIVVQVNGATIPNNTANGWTYNSAANSILFHGTGIPSQNAIINVAFIPSNLNGN